MGGGRVGWVAASAASLAIVAAILLWSVVVVLNHLMVPGPARQAALMLVESGDDTARIAERLKTQDIIRSPEIFQIAARLRGVDRELKPGEYEIPPQASLLQVLDILREGRTVERRITFPEGLSSWQIVDRLREVPEELLTGEITEIPPEGSLFPASYDYVRGQTRQSILDVMKAEMDRRRQQAWDLRTQQLPIATPEQLVVLASIVEKETGLAGERKQVAAVFINRLRRDMPLQSDPTVVYVLTDKGRGPLGRRLLRSDLEIDSPYNTYRNRGLPPTPIANPGMDSLMAVAQPDRHDYLYFVADGTGGHAFAETLEEHNRNVENWRRIRAAQENGADDEAAPAAEPPARN